MKPFLTKLALTTAILSGAAVAAQACPQTTAMGKDSTGSFQLAQAGGSSGTGSSTGAGGTTGNSAGSPTGGSTGSTTSPSVGNGNNSTSGSSGKQIIPPEERMRDPSTPAVPGQPGSQPNR
jgi:hypothetical protein